MEECNAKINAKDIKIKELEEIIGTIEPDQIEANYERIIELREVNEQVFKKFNQLNSKVNSRLSEKTDYIEGLENRLSNIEDNIKNIAKPPFIPSVPIKITPYEESRKIKRRSKESRKEEIEEIEESRKEEIEESRKEEIEESRKEEIEESRKEEIEESRKEEIEEPKKVPPTPVYTKPKRIVGGTLDDFYRKFAKSPIKNPGGKNPPEYNGDGKHNIPKNQDYIEDSRKHYNTINDVSRRLMDIHNKKNGLRA